MKDPFLSDSPPFSTAGTAHTRYRHRLWITALLFLALSFYPCLLHGKSLFESPHGDKTRVLKGCRSCHRGHGTWNTPMLSDEKERFCFRCHGDSFMVQQTRSQGILSNNTKAADISKEFLKLYRHPVENSGIHQHDETLPETDPAAPRHAECRDCHHHHYVTSSNKSEGIAGITPQGALVTSIQSEYELCFKCHSYSANLPADQTNKAEMFKTGNPSYHPVVDAGKNSFVPSLIPPLTEASIIQCSDCHNNDDPLGPRGPHGSNHRYLLTRNFSDLDGNESPYQYELCYGCHKRSSILGNESFRYHNLHITTAGASCRTCHNPHGSLLYPHLIDLENLNIMPSNSGRLEYVDMGEKAGECFLNCHNKEHDPARYPVPVPAGD
ncbi:MAG: cytochrome c3 family protein [Nitrospirota bacterium]